MYVIDYAKRVVEEHIPALPKSAQILIKRAIEERLAHHPQQYDKPLRNSLVGHRRLRVSDYRVIYRIDEKRRIVYISAIGFRRDIYEH
jgi:mRNA interferase RelE/StbE